TVTKRFSHELQVIGNYTWSKNLQFSSSPDVFNWNMGKDVSGLNFPNQFRLSFEYEVQRPAAFVPVLGNKIVSRAIGGWSVSGYTIYQSAAYLTRPTNGAANPI